MTWCLSCPSTYLTASSAPIPAPLRWTVVFFLFGVGVPLVIAWFFALKILLFYAGNLQNRGKAAAHFIRNRRFAWLLTLWLWVRATSFGLPNGGTPLLVFLKFRFPSVPTIPLTSRWTILNIGSISAWWPFLLSSRHWNYIPVGQGPEFFLSRSFICLVSTI